MATNFKFILLACLAFVLTACPGDGDCSSSLDQADIPGLVIATPLQDQYQVGDVITVKVSLPSKNTFFSSEGDDLYAATHDDSARLIFSGFESCFPGNALTLITGSQSSGNPNWFECPYNTALDSYEFEMKLQLNKAGTYSFFADASLDFRGSGCLAYLAVTTFQGAATDNKISFVVAE